MIKNILKTTATLITGLMLTLTASLIAHPGSAQAAITNAGPGAAYNYYLDANRIYIPQSISINLNNSDITYRVYQISSFDRDGNPIPSPTFNGTSADIKVEDYIDQFIGQVLVNHQGSTKEDMEYLYDLTYRTCFDETGNYRNNWLATINSNEKPLWDKNEASPTYNIPVHFYPGMYLLIDANINNIADLDPSLIERGWSTAQITTLTIPYKPEYLNNDAGIDDPATLDDLDIFIDIEDDVITERIEDHIQMKTHSLINFNGPYLKPYHPKSFLGPIPLELADLLRNTDDLPIKTVRANNMDNYMKAANDTIYSSIA